MVNARNVLGVVTFYASHMFMSLNVSYTVCLNVNSLPVKSIVICKLSSHVHLVSLTYTIIVTFWLDPKDGKHKGLIVICTRLNFQDKSLHSMFKLEI